MQFDFLCEQMHVARSAYSFREALWNHSVVFSDDTETPVSLAQLEPPFEIVFDYPFV